MEQRSVGREPANIWREWAPGEGPVQSPEVGRVLGRFQKEQKGQQDCSLERRGVAADGAIKETRTR